MYFPGLDRRIHLRIVAQENIFDMAEISRHLSGTAHRRESAFVNGRSMYMATVGTIWATCRELEIDWVPEILER